MNPDRARRQGGLTLIEMLIAVIILTIVLAFGVPVFNDLIANTRVSAATNTLIAHLQYARSEATRRGGGRVAVGPIINDTTWKTSKPKQWESGYVVAVVDKSSPPKILQVLRRVDPGDIGTLTITSSISPSRIVFDADGSISTGNSTLTVCDPKNPAHKKAVMVSTVGRARVSDFQDTTGAALKCP
jgi:prepilin-type N-terminal cleavage/methylation domain-containing protein